MMSVPIAWLVSPRNGPAANYASAVIVLGDLGKASRREGTHLSDALHNAWLALIVLGLSQLRDEIDRWP